MFCTLCKKCIDICPTGALRWHPETAAVELIAEKCTACGKCVDICPTKVITHSEQAFSFDGVDLPWIPVICDLCGGDPACTRICPTQAIFSDERVKVN
jgi:ferredoxin